MTFRIINELKKIFKPINFNSSCNFNYSYYMDFIYEF